MKTILAILLLSLLAGTAYGQAVTADCVNLYTGSAVTSSQTALTPVRVNPRWKFFKFAVTSQINSGTTPTLDVKIQNCRSTTTGTCHDTPAIFTQCSGVGACSSDGYEVYDGTFNLEGYVRPYITLGGTSPNVDVIVDLCAAQ